MPSTSQLANLEKMMSFVSTPTARDLVRCVWEFFGYHLFCVLREDSQPSRYRLPLAKFLDGGTRLDVVPSIEVRKSWRTEEAFVHELLHLDLARRGYPRFLLRHPRTPERRSLLGGVQNNADHVIMRPVFIGLGYREECFLGAGPDRALTSTESTVLHELSAMSPTSSPAQYRDFVSLYLSRHGIHFQSVSLLAAGA